MKFTTAEESVKIINSGDRIFIQSVSAAPAHREELERQAFERFHKFD